MDDSVLEWLCTFAEDQREAYGVLNPKDKKINNYNITQKRNHNITFAKSEIADQLPLDNVNRPSPTRANISDGVSLGPVANGVCLQKQTSQ